MKQIEFLKEKNITISQIDDSTTFQLKKLFILANKIPSPIKKSEVNDLLTKFISSALRDCLYSGAEFVKISEKLIDEYATYINLDEVVHTLSYLCQIHFSINEMYYEKKISQEIGKYFSERWLYYSPKKNTTINDLIYNYYISYLIGIFEKKPSINDIHEIINSQGYLNSEYGEFQKKNIIIWISDNYFKNREDNVCFLSKYKNDKAIKRKIESIYKK
ncbi:hypothetical protein Pecwa_0525 [Pectobacterium parmentieri WPP163]|uniref:hypothetical protein n=1 Tax=Pectobacterium parmentieri TaxID=1905730 RepID=UPI0001BA0D5B|nr:hypothetical protein [Pectobacterium parmentieri]ACX86358.1 hypothetical protein Pecwa_0525 [Pectobacterium parmentieri WPP163]QQA75433.1 hypothetical protein JBL47_19240 [Pectobacterium parmentieri]